MINGAGIKQRQCKMAIAASGAGYIASFCNLHIKGIKLDNGTSLIVICHMAGIVAELHCFDWEGKFCAICQSVVFHPYGTRYHLHQQCVSGSSRLEGYTGMLTRRSRTAAHRYT